MASPQLPSSQPIVIVGGGISGLSIAVRLSQSGLRVLLLEASDLGLGAASKNQGWLYSGAWFAPRQRNLAWLCYESLQDTIRFCPECLEPQVGTMIYIISSPLTDPADWTEPWTEAGIPYEQVSVEFAVEKTGLSRSMIKHAFRLPDRAIRPRILLERLTAQAEYQGVDIRTRSPITSLLKSGDRVRAVLSESGEAFDAGLFILAANAGGTALWANPLHMYGAVGAPQSEFTRVALKTHCLTIQPQLASTPYCVVDLEGINHIPHPPASIFGSSRWLPVRDSTDQRVVGSEVNRLRKLVTTLYSRFQPEKFEVLEWAGTTMQAMHVEQVEPGLAPMPTVIDHEFEPPYASNVLSVFPGRGTLWPQLAEATRFAVLEKLGQKISTDTKAPWALDDAGDRSGPDTANPSDRSCA